MVNGGWLEYFIDIYLLGPAKEEKARSKRPRSAHVIVVEYELGQSYICLGRQTPRSPRVSYVLAIGSPALSSALDDSPLQQQSVAQAMAVILGADAQVMESFRRGFAMRSFRRDTRRAPHLCRRSRR